MIASVHQCDKNEQKVNENRKLISQVFRMSHHIIKLENKITEAELYLTIR